MVFALDVSKLEGRRWNITMKVSGRKNPGNGVASIILECHMFSKSFSATAVNLALINIF